jgi:CubicO group peptidase (beta-lactamase class C family)
VVEAEIFAPLGMASTRYEVSGSPKPALGYTRRNPDSGHLASSGWYPAWEEPKPGDDCMPCTPMGGGYATADDLARFGDALVGNRLLGREMTNLVLTGVIDADYGGRDGFGFETRLVNGARIVGHRGALSGSSNEVDFYPDLGYAVVVLGNIDDSSATIARHLRVLLTTSPSS